MAKAIPHGFEAGNLVKVSSKNLRGFELGIVHKACRYDDGIIVQIADGKDVTTYECISPTREGDSIVVITKPRVEE